jgi:hypothetical protein
MSLQGLLLLDQVFVSTVVLVVETALAFHISSSHEENLLFFFETQL